MTGVVFGGDARRRPATPFPTVVPFARRRCLSRSPLVWLLLFPLFFVVLLQSHLGRHTRSQKCTPTTRQHQQQPEASCGHTEKKTRRRRRSWGARRGKPTSSNVAAAAAVDDDEGHARLPLSDHYWAVNQKPTRRGNETKRNKIKQYNGLAPDVPRGGGI